MSQFSRKLPVSSHYDELQKETSKQKETFWLKSDPFVSCFSKKQIKMSLSLFLNIFLRQIELEELR